MKLSQYASRCGDNASRSETRLERQDKTDTRHSPIKSVGCSMNQDYKGTNLKTKQKLIVIDICEKTISKQVHLNKTNYR